MCVGHSDTLGRARGGLGLACLAVFCARAPGWRSRGTPKPEAAGFRTWGLAVTELDHPLVLDDTIENQKYVFKVPYSNWRSDMARCLGFGGLPGRGQKNLFCDAKLPARTAGTACKAGRHDTPRIVTRPLAQRCTVRALSSRFAGWARGVAVEYPASCPSTYGSRDTEHTPGHTQEIYTAYSTRL